MAAPKGNLFALGLENSGRPPKYEDAEAMAQKIAEYIDYEDSLKNVDSKGNGKGIYTLSGCALFLGFASLQSMYDYENRSKEFSYIINRFRRFLTHWNEQKLYCGGTFAGANFWLRNHGGYTEESTVNNNNREVKANFGGTTIQPTPESGEDT